MDPLPRPAHATPLSEAERWAKRFVPRPEARLRLLCFPHAGSGAGAYRRLAAQLPSEVETLPVEYPGRWTRNGEPPLPDVLALAEGAARAVPPLLDRPYAVLGCSFGALVAFEFVRRLAERGLPPPRAFLACAQRAPHLPIQDAPLHALPDAELMRAMVERYGPGPGGPIEDPALLAIVLPPLRADLRARAGYRYQPGPPLAVPVWALGGEQDRSVPPGDLGAWREHTSGPFAERLLPGDHFFFASPEGPFLDVLRQALPHAPQS